MKKFSRIQAAVLALIMASSVFSACGSSNSAAASSTAASSTAASSTAASSTAASSSKSSDLQNCTLVWVGAGWAANDKAKNIIAKWNAKYPNVKVEYTELSSSADDEYKKNLDVMIAGGQEVDITYLTADDVYNRVMNGGALALDDYITAMGDNYKSDFGSLAVTSMTYNGKIYGVPYANNTYKVFYNADMVKAAGLTIPSTWSYKEFTEIAKKLTTADCYGCIFPSTWYDLCYAPAEVSGWQMVKVDSSGKVTPNFDDAIFKTDMQWIYDLAETDKVSPSYATIKAESLNRRQALATQKAAMIVDGPYTLVWLQKYMFDDPAAGALPFTLGVADLPYITDAGKSCSFNALVGAFYVPKTAKYPKEAYAFEHFLCTEVVASTVYMPTYTGADMKEATSTFTTYTDTKGTVHKDVYPEAVALSAVATPFESHISKYNRDPSLAKYYSLLGTLFSEQYTTFLSGEQTIDQFVENLQTLGAQEIANAG